jgi:hypothetical protein
MREYSPLLHHLFTKYSPDGAPPKVSVLNERRSRRKGSAVREFFAGGKEVAHL